MGPADVNRDGLKETRQLENTEHDVTITFVTQASNLKMSLN